jgi:hypothetical protein
VALQLDIARDLAADAHHEDVDVRLVEVRLQLRVAPRVAIAPVPCVPDGGIQMAILRRADRPLALHPDHRVAHAASQQRLGVVQAQVGPGDGGHRSTIGAIGDVEVTAG